MEHITETDHRFDQLTDQFLSGYFRFNPTLATDLGFHEYDSRLEDRSAPAVQAEIERLKDFQRRLQREIDPAALSVERQIDCAILCSAMESRRLDLEEIRTWQRNPGYYNWLASGSVYSLLIREYAPLNDRLRAAIERERGISALLEHGRTNYGRPSARRRACRGYGLKSRCRSSRGRKIFFERWCRDSLNKPTMLPPGRR